MAWKMVRNDQPTHKEESHSGECPRFHKRATATGQYFGRYVAKTDLVPTYTRIGYQCTLSDEVRENGLCCMESQCPLMPEKYL